MWKNFISSVKNNVKDILSETQIDEQVFQYSQIQHANTNKTKSCHEYDLNEMFPFKKTKILKKESLESLSETLRIPSRELLTINNISVNNVYTKEHPRIQSQIVEKFKAGKFILVPAKARVHRPIRERLMDLSVKDIKDFKMEKIMPKLDEPTYFCYYCTINGDILGKMTFCQNSLVFNPLNHSLNDYFSYESENLLDNTKMGFILDYQDIINAVKIPTPIMCGNDNILDFKNFDRTTNSNTNFNIQVEVRHTGF